MNSNNKRRLAVDDVNQSPLKKQKIALYLDDYTPIRTIEVTRFGENVSSDYLRGYFEHASGPVSDLSIIDKRENDQMIRVAYVTFSIPEDAARLICEPNSKMDMKFTIKQAESVHQPKIDPNVLKFEEINDDCLLHITSYLNLIDIVNLGKTSSRMQSFAQQIYRKRIHFSFGSTNTGDSSINEINIQTILQEMGSFIHSIEWHYLSWIHLVYLSQYCHNVDELKLIYPSNRLHSRHMKASKEFFQKITKLSIYGATFYDATLKIITTSSSRLESLALEHCPNICGKFLSTLKKPELKCLVVSNNSKVGCENVFEFVQQNELVKFSFDASSSFKKSLTLPADCLSKFEHIELDFSYYIDFFLKDLNFGSLTQLSSLTMTYKHFESSESSNDLLMAISHIPKLDSLTIESIIIDAGTVQCLASFKNLRKIKLKRVNNTIGRQLYTSLHVHLPKITELSIDMRNTTEKIDSQSICEMISELVDLNSFSHSSMTWELLDAIRQVRLFRSVRPLEIGIPEIMFNIPRTKAFAAISNGAVKLSLKE